MSLENIRPSHRMFFLSFFHGRVKQLSVTDTNRLAELECQLKMKTYELDRCSILLAEMEAKYKHVTSLKENLERKLEVVAPFSSLCCHISS